jgi:hypothetical protein
MHAEDQSAMAPLSGEWHPGSIPDIPGCPGARRLGAVIPDARQRARNDPPFRDHPIARV